MSAIDASANSSLMSVAWILSAASPSSLKRSVLKEREKVSNHQIQSDLD